jgi:hypothetical protein
VLFQALVILLLTAIAVELEMLRRAGRRQSAPAFTQPDAPTPEPRAAPEKMVHLLLNGEHHSWRPPWDPDVAAVRRGEHPGMTVEE